MNKNVILGFLVVSLVLMISWAGARGYESYKFDKYAGGHLKRAANSNTVELATSELEIAIKYIERNNLTQGSTYIIFDTPDKDIGFWYDNLTSTLKELKKVNSSTSQLERTNLLMKLRESVTDQDSDGATVVIVPPGISVYPHNLLFAIWGWLSLIALLIWTGIAFKKLYQY
jgi:hypothetical protein